MSVCNAECLQDPFPRNQRCQCCHHLDAPSVNTVIIRACYKQLHGAFWCDMLALLQYELTTFTSF